MVHLQGLKNRTIKTGPTEKRSTRLSEKRSTRISGSQLKVKNQTMAYRWTYGKDPPKSEKILSAIYI